jgi:hypothetical protein
MVKVPYFQGPTIDSSTILVQSKICSVLHSAFVLRGKVGEVAHRALLMKLEERLSKEASSKINKEPSGFIPPATLPSAVMPHGMTLMPVVGPPPAMTVVMPQQPSQQFVHSFAPPPLPIVAAQQQYMGQYIQPLPSSQLPPPPPFMPPPPPLIPTMPMAPSSQPPQSMGFQPNIKHFQATR